MSHCYRLAFVVFPMSTGQCNLPVFLRMGGMIKFLQHIHHNSEISYMVELALKMKVPNQTHYKFYKTLEQNITMLFCQLIALQIYPLCKRYKPFILVVYKLTYRPALTLF